MTPTIDIGQPAPDFTLPDLNGAFHSLSALRGRIVVVNFWSAECPWSERADRDLVQALGAWGPAVALLSVAPNANEPPELLESVASGRGLPLVLVDSGQRVADRYGALVTPHLYVVDADGVLRYQGAPDDVTFRQRQASRPYLRLAVEALLEGRLPNPAETPPFGCSIVRFSA